MLEGVGTRCVRGVVVRGVTGGGGRCVRGGTG